jgi:hypothetical protein
LQYGFIWPEESKNTVPQFNTKEESEVAPFPIENPEFVDELLSDIGLETLAERKRYMQRLEDIRVKIRKNG